jgi:hypothetical protein
MLRARSAIKISPAVQRGIFLRSGQFFERRERAGDEHGADEVGRGHFSSS